MINSIIILGGHIQALGLARQANKKGLKVIIIIPDGYSVARFSRYVSKVFVCSTEELLLECLDNIKSKETLLFPTSDDYIDFIVRHQVFTSEAYTVALPELITVKLFADKTLAYQFAEKNLIPHPWCRYPKTIEDVESMADGLDYPVVVKPAVMYDFHKKFGKKAFLCDGKEALLAIVLELNKTDYPINAIIIQEYLSGGAKYLYSCGVFAVDGEVISSITVNRIRQNPMDFGNSTTFAETVDVPEILEITKRIIKLTNYTGVGEVEFMYDKGEYKFLEINTRAWKWHTITDGRGFSFIGDWIDWLNTGFVSISHPSHKKCAWVERLTDFAVIVKGLFRGQVKFGEAIQSYCQRKVSAVWSIKDPLPAIMYFLMSPILFLKRY